MKIRLKSKEMSIYINPEQIVCVYHEIGSSPILSLSNGKDYEITKYSYYQILAWLEPNR